MLKRKKVGRQSRGKVNVKSNNKLRDSLAEKGKVKNESEK